MGKMIDETGNKYGKLTVIKKSDKKGNGIYWECLCDCGKTTIALGSKLRKGERVSCGCQRNEKLSLIAKSRVAKNEVGNVYGKLAVIKLDHINEKGERYWKCQCECGNTAIVRGSHLTSGKTKSCGCLNSKGEYLITQFLTNNNIDFETQKTFKECKFEDTNFLAKFDFYLPTYNLCIEYDGIQHFQAGGFITEEKFEKIKEHDKTKNIFCQENNIDLLRISYKENIEEKLKEKLFLQT